jgi:formylmethanofuran dehydrogenase subunit A
MIRLKGGRIIDPANERDEIADLWLDGDRIAEAPADGRADETYDLTGKIVMAGGIDIHSHIVGANVNTARLMLSEQHRSPAPQAADPSHGASALTTFDNGRLYAQMGFTLVVDPAVNPDNALQAHLELALTPFIDRGAFIILGNEDFLLKMLRDHESPDMVQDYVATKVHAAQGLGVKVINAGGAAAFKHNIRAFSFDDVVPSYGVSSRDIVLSLQRAVHAVGVPHPLHVHCNNLGLAGSAGTAELTMEGGSDLPMHLAHLQFYSYGTEGKRGISSAAARLAEKVNTLPNVTIDVGQVMFGPTVTVSADTLRQFDQKRFARPRKWTIWEDVGNGGGIFPIVYGEKEFTSALQWAIGLELFLLIDSPWQVYFTTDHPNGAPFTRYPEILHLLMSADERDRWMERLPKTAIESTVLPAIRREYSLFEIATMTRAAPARLLGLADRGHLGRDAIADVAVYHDRKHRAAMFRSAHLVFKSGELIVRDGSVTQIRWGRTLTLEARATGVIGERLSAYQEALYGRPVGHVRESAVASVAGVESAFETVPCRN